MKISDEWNIITEYLSDDKDIKELAMANKFIHNIIIKPNSKKRVCKLLLSKYFNKIVISKKEDIKNVNVFTFNKIIQQTIRCQNKKFLEEIINLYVYYLHPETCHILVKSCPLNYIKFIFESNIFFFQQCVQYIFSLACQYDRVDIIKYLSNREAINYNLYGRWIDIAAYHKSNNTILFFWNTRHIYNQSVLFNIASETDNYLLAKKLVLIFKNKNISNDIVYAASFDSSKVFEILINEKTLPVDIITESIIYTIYNLNISILALLVNQTNIPFCNVDIWSIICCQVSYFYYSESEMKVLLSMIDLLIKKNIIDHCHNDRVLVKKLIQCSDTKEKTKFARIGKKLFRNGKSIRSPYLLKDIWKKIEI